MKNANRKFENTYFSMLLEDTDCDLEQDNLERKKPGENQGQNKEREESEENKSSIDELTDENTATIDEDFDEDNNNDDGEAEANDDDNENLNDGWGENIIDICNNLINDFDGFAYELKNCVRGSYTGAKTTDDLIEYLTNMKDNIDEVINDLNSVK